MRASKAGVMAGRNREQWRRRFWVHPERQQALGSKHPCGALTWYMKQVP